MSSNILMQINGHFASSCYSEDVQATFSGCLGNNLSNLKPGHTRAVQFGTPGGQRGGVGQDWVPTELIAQETKVPCSLQDIEPVESKTRTYHGRVGSWRPAERPGGIGQDRVPTKFFAQETHVYRTLPKRYSRSTNKRNPM